MTAGTAGSSALLSVENLTAGYGGAPVIRSVSLIVEPGRAACVVGANGSGKSTLLRAILGTIRVSEGRVRLSGVDVTNWETDRIIRSGVAYVPQLDDVFFPLTVEENLALGGYTVPRHSWRKRAAEVLGLFPVLADKRGRVARTLSGGERKMLALARALMTSPQLLVLDEPTANLAPNIASTLLKEQVPRLIASGVAVLLVEQRARDALRVSDEGYVMVTGQIALRGGGAELAGRPDLSDLFLGARPEHGRIRGATVGGA
jgi:ABC-type branched-subunit amino acid transport system ATPase component